MRHLISIVEAWDNSIKGNNPWHAEPVDIFRNPSRSEFFKILKQSQQKELRGEIERSSGDLLVWDAYFATHGDIDEHYEISGVYLILTPTLVGLNDFHGHREDNGRFGDFAREKWNLVANNAHLKAVYGSTLQIVGIDSGGQYSRNVVWDGKKFARTKSGGFSK